MQTRKTFSWSQKKKKNKITDFLGGGTIFEISVPKTNFTNSNEINELTFRRDIFLSKKAFLFFVFII